MAIMSTFLMFMETATPIPLPRIFIIQEATDIGD
jgi:hypothetical protein